MSEYNDISVSIYDSLHSQKDYSGEVDYVIDLDPVQTKVLDIGCGTGSHLQEFCKRGYEVHGVDPSSSMIEIARDKLQKYNPQLIIGTVSDISVRVPLVVSLFNVINHIRDMKELKSFMESVSLKLESPGIFVFDCFNHDAFVEDEPREVYTPELTLIPETDYTNNTMKLNGIFRETPYTVTHKIWTNEELGTVLSSVGFDYKVYKSFSDQTATSSDYKVTYVCEMSDD